MSISGSVEPLLEENMEKVCLAELKCSRNYVLEGIYEKLLAKMFGRAYLLLRIGYMIIGPPK